MKHNKEVTYKDLKKHTWGDLIGAFKGKPTTDAEINTTSFLKKCEDRDFGDEWVELENYMPFNINSSKLEDCDNSEI